MLNYTKLQEQIDKLGLSRKQVMILLNETATRCTRNRDASVKRILRRLSGKRQRLKAEEDGILDAVLRGAAK